jgi:hypothetical protein
MDRRFLLCPFCPCARDRKEILTKLKRCRKGKVEKIWQEQGQGICGRKKCGKFGLKLGSYRNKATELHLKYASPIPPTCRLETSIFVDRQVTLSAEQ